ncbi:cyclin-D4-1-like isoform X2 [Actinidia eriantha]|uniref:cyclin-D4-1-like isoform X2 n=1 Tax=Actinidia eriantha TaxID=165200 RepID=UPI00258EFF97|nr:cyclin-D4-1-like isoform X2 [Actinidia eriantha]
MARSFDCAASGLLCSEDNISIFCDEVDLGAIDEDFEPSWKNRNYGNNNQNKNFDRSELLSDWPMQSDECLALMLKKEIEHLPASDYLQRLRDGDLDLGARREAVDWIGKVVAHFNFGPLCTYLSISYLDRFLSVHELPGKAWMMQLLAVSCLSLAAKMEETEVHLPLDLQVGECKFVFEAITMQRMELMVLSTLKWRMQAITPFSFIDYFLAKINGDDKIPPRSSIFVSTQLILGIIKGIDFLEFRPSEVAAAAVAVAVSVAGETQTVDIENSISFLTQHVEKENVVKCVELIHESSLTSGSIKGLSASIPFLPQSPIGVLDAACLSYKTDETTVGSCANSFDHNSSPNTKRRKLNRPIEVEEI